MTGLALFLLTALAVVALRAHFLSFRAQRPADYGAQRPAFLPKTHLAGEMLAEGVIFGPTGRVVSSFTARMEGRWEGDAGTLTERFTYATGRVQVRQWRLMAGQGGRLTATADDIVGTAEGVIAGNALRLRYRIILPEEAGGHRLDVTDWLYLTADGTIVNRSEMRKFGIRVAELIATIRPVRR